MADAPMPAKPAQREVADIAEEDDNADAIEEKDTAEEPLADAATPDPSPYRARRMPTSATAATAATVPDDLGPGARGDDGDDQNDPTDAPKQSFFKRIGLDMPTLMMMFKGSLPPTIGIAMYQSDAVANTFTTLGYLIPIVTVMNMVIMPRGKFIQTVTLNILAVSTASALALLMLYCGIQARAHTSGPLTADELASYQATGRPPYNASQSTVCAIWLIFNIWMVNTIRAKLPTFNLPSIVFSIVINVACTFGPLLTTMTQAMAFVKQLYTGMLTSMALATGVSLFVLPVSSRQILMAQAGGAIGLLRKAVSLQGEYLRGLEREDMYALATVETAVGNLGPAKENERRREQLRRKFRKLKKQAPPPLTKEEKAAQALRTTIDAMRELAGKMQQEIHFAKRDAAFGKLTAHDLKEIVRLLRNIFIPVTGMSTIMDIFRRTAEHRGWNETEDLSEEDAATKDKERRVWNEVMQQLHEPFTLLSEAIDEGLEHAGLQLALLPKTKEQKAKDKQARKERLARKKSGDGDKVPANGGDDTSNGNAKNGDQEKEKESTPSDDVEARGDLLKPGEEGFAAVINDKVKNFSKTRSDILRIWARERGLMGDSMPSDPTKSDSAQGLDPVFMAREHRQSQLYVLLYMEQLMIATGEAVQDFVEFADKKVADGTMDKTRLLVPTLRRVRKWVTSIFNDEDGTNADGDDVLKPNFNVVFLGDSFNAKKDPEHLPPTNAWQRFGNGIRAVSRFLGSSESMFGLRVACATMTVAVLCFLRNTQVFFQEQRLVWAMIIIAIGMTQTSGQSIFGFFCRVGGSFLAMVFSFIIWYIVDQKTPGVIVFMWFFIFLQYYFLMKYPRFIPASMIMIVTQVLIIGYELQVRKIGVARSQSTGQRYYPTYELAPYRLGTVSAGCLIAFIWTIFPRPMTDRAWLRRDLSATLYLLANYFSVINETLKTTMYQTGGNMDIPGTPAHRLWKIRQKLFSKLMLLLPSLQMHSGWQKWEPAIGGEFPRATYEDIILRSGRIMNYLTLISYTVTWKPRHAPQLLDDTWLEALKELIKSIGPTHYTILSTLTLLSNSLLSGQSLPPYIPLPRPYELTRQLLALRQAPRPEEGSHKKTGSGTGRRNSIWGKQGWRPEKVSSHGDETGGLYVRQNEVDEDVFLPPRRHNTATNKDRANWHDLADEVSTATGNPTLMRMPTVTATNLGGLLDARNMEQHGYTEFAVLQVCSTLVCDDLEGMIQDVSKLVGVVDFSFKIDDSEGSLTDKGKGKKD